MSSLKCEYISSYGQRRNISFLKTAHWYGLNFLYLFIRPENLNLKISENLAALTFLREKVSTFAKRYIYTLLLLITLCNMPKGLISYHSIDFFSYSTIGHGQKGHMNKDCPSFCSWNWFFSFFWNSTWC